MNLNKKISIYKINYNDIDIPAESINNFQKIFTLLRKKLQIKNLRKNHLDSLLKKIKGKFCKAIHEGLKVCLNLLINRLPQSFITNITLDYNKKMLNKKIIEIYDEYKILPEIDKMKNYLKNDKKEIFFDFIHQKYKECYDSYIKSDRFKKDLNEIVMLEGKKFGILYEFVAINFILYYENNQQIFKKTEEEKSLDISKEKEDIKNEIIEDKKLFNISTEQKNEK
jgi:hypothetical protein